MEDREMIQMIVDRATVGWRWLGVIPPIGQGGGRRQDADPNQAESVRERRSPRLTGSPAQHDRQCP